MKVKHTKNGNVKLVMSMEQAAHLKMIITMSGDIDYCDPDVNQEEVEETSWAIYEGMVKAGFDD